MTNNFNFFEASILDNGAYTGKIAENGYKLVQEKGKKPYIEIHVIANNADFAFKLYENRIPYFMEGIATQTDGATARLKLSELLEELKTREFTTWVSYNGRYGQQFNWREPYQR